MAFPLTFDKMKFTKCAAETMVYVERHKILDIMTQVLAEISIQRPANPRLWIARNIERIADILYKSCIRIAYEADNGPKNFQLPRRFHHRIAIYGRRGSGRKSQAQSLAKQFNLVYIDASILIEHNLAAKSCKAAKFQSEFDTEIYHEKSKALCDLLSERLLQPDCLRKGWVIVNFPNNIEECKQLFEQFTVPPNKFVLLECPEDMAMQRALAKPALGCPQDFTSYIELEMSCYNREEVDMTNYLSSRYETVFQDACPPFEAVRISLVGKLERSPYLMGIKNI